jgi:hypothetical protein
LTGELSTNAISEGEDPLKPTHGTLVLPGVNAQHHQHMFCMRLDMAVDNEAGGQGLIVSEVGRLAVQDLAADCKHYGLPLKIKRGGGVSMHSTTSTCSACGWTWQLKMRLVVSEVGVAQF